MLAFGVFPTGFNKPRSTATATISPAVSGRRACRSTTSAASKYVIVGAVPYRGRRSGRTWEGSRQLAEPVPARLYHPTSDGRGRPQAVGGDEPGGAPRPRAVPSRRRHPAQRLRQGRRATPRAAGPAADVAPTG